MQIGSIEHPSRVVLAPMAGVTDQPFRNLCRSNGAFWTVSEMLTSNQALWHTRKSQSRLQYSSEQGPRWIQIAGGDPQMLADAAMEAERLGADIIDINMGCPAKKVCKKAAGSALMKDERLVRQIFQQVSAAVSVPLTVKIRLGWSLDEINAVTIARLAEDHGFSLVTVHGRSRACKFAGDVHYDEIHKVVRALEIPVVANGDIQTPEHAKAVLENTGASAVMIGRAAQGRPWLLAQIDHFLETGKIKKDPPTSDIKRMLKAHVEELARFYGERAGPRIARKHVGWYLAEFEGLANAKQNFNKLENVEEQLKAIEDIFRRFAQQSGLAA